MPYELEKKYAKKNLQRISKDASLGSVPSPDVKHIDEIYFCFYLNHFVAITLLFLACTTVF